MQGYKKVLKEKERTNDNEIRVTAKGQIKKYLGYALSAFNKRSFEQIEIRGTGNAIVKALILIELVKRRVGDLHQINNITSTEIVDEFEPEIEGLERIEQRRRVTCLNCILSKTPLDQTNIGYQKPEAKE
jgi:DNA-binding protein